MNLCVNEYLDSVSAWIIVNNIIRSIARSSVQGFALICTFVLVILFTQLQYGACTFMCNDCIIFTSLYIHVV